MFQMTTETHLDVVLSPFVKWPQIEIWEVPSEHQEMLLAIRATNHWLPREVVEFPSLKILKSHLNRVLSS